MNYTYDRRISTTPKDTRKITWPEIEEDIQQRAPKKDPLFRLAGPWKKLVGTHDGFQIYLVDGTWVRNNLSVHYGHGGHGIVHEFIPNDEIWVSTHHFNCGCKDVKPGQPVSREWFESTMEHEITEFKNMSLGRDFWQAHNQALEKEEDLGLLPDPYSDPV